MFRQGFSMSRSVRTEMLLGREAVEKLRVSRVLVFGLGGVGSYAVEALARCGVGAIDVCDNDIIAESNLNRQLYALEATVGRKKTELAAERIAAIDKNIEVVQYDCFFDGQTVALFDFKRYNYIIDCIDTVKSKLLIVSSAYAAGVPVISSMGTGNRLDPTAFSVCDISQTSGCPLARAVRHGLKQLGIRSLKVVFSSEQALEPLCESDGKSIGSVSFVPPVAGFILAGEAVKDMVGGCLRVDANSK